MNIFVIDTSMELGTVGIKIKDKIVADIHFEIKKGAVNTVHSYIEDAFKTTKLSPTQIDLIGVIIGPGSFTGLRVALAAAKGLAHPYKTPIVGIESTLAIASVIDDKNTITAIIDARRSQFYRGIFKKGDDGFQRLSGPEAVNKELVLKSIPEGSIVTGPGIKKLNKDVLKQYTIPHEDLIYPSTEVLCSLAFSFYSKREFLNLEDSTPLYIRKPDANPNIDKR